MLRPRGVEVDEVEGDTDDVECETTQGRRTTVGRSVSGSRAERGMHVAMVTRGGEARRCGRR